MKRSVALVLAIGLLTGSGAVAFAISPFGVTEQQESELEPLWISDTPREIETNHHKIGATADGSLILAPIAVPAGHESIGSTGRDDRERDDHHDGDGHRHDTHRPTDSGSDSTPSGDGATTGVVAACELVSLNRDGSVDWANGIQPANCTAHSVTEPHFGDLNGDGEREIAYGTTENAVIVLDGNGTELRRVPLESYGHGRPTIDNLTSAPGPEIVASDIRGNVVVADRDGVVWRASADGTTYPAPIVADVTGDGRAEAVITTSQRTVAFDRHGDRVWEAAVGGWTSTLGPDSETLYVGGSSAVFAIDGRTGRIEWERRIDGRPTVGGVAESEGRSVVLVGRNGGQILALDADTGERVWVSDRPPEGERRTPAPVLGDVTGDGTIEAIVVTNGGHLSVVDAADGTVTSRYRTGVPVWVPVTLADLDGDGTDEMLVRLGDGRVLALEVAESNATANSE